MGALTDLSIHSIVCLFLQRARRRFLDRVRWVSLIAAVLLKSRQRIWNQQTYLWGDTYVDFRAGEVQKEDVYIKLYMISEYLLYMGKVCGS